ncbi:MAG: MATE family efflux transporter [Prevotella sp.]|nr:MATE family efflux transporter [Prevotella sp.]
MKAIDREIWRLTLPSIVSNITVPLLGLCDVTIMGHVGGATHIGAIAVGSMIFNVMYWLFGFLRMGTSGLTAQAFGRQAAHALSDGESSTLDILHGSLLSALLLGAAIVVLQVPLQLLTFWLMQPTPDVSALCTPYYYTCVWGAPAVLGLYALTGWLVGMQDTRLPMMIAIGQNVVNIVASLLLVLVFHLGVQGVALGTLIAQWAGFGFALLSILRSVKVKVGSDKQRRFFATFLTFHFSLLTNGRVYLEIFLRTVCLVAVNLYFTSAGAVQGAEILAANTLLMQLFTLFSYVMDGLAFAGEALAGKSYGAADLRQLHHTVGHLFAWGGGVAVLFTVAYWLGGTAFLGLLTSDRQVVATAAAYLPWAVLIPVAGTAAFVWDGVFIGITATRGMLLACLVAAVSFFALWLLFSPSLQNHALWLALIAYLALRGIVQTVYYRGVRSKRAGQ